jgi:aspartate kinase
MLMAYGFMASIFELFNRFETPVDLVSTSEVSVSVTIDNPERLDEIVQELSRFAEVGVSHNKAIVCVVGENICQEVGMPARVFGELKDAKIELISQGASEINISFVVDESDLPRIVHRLHDSFFSGPLDDTIFAPAAAG